MPPETSYAKSGDVHIAYQVLGDGPIDLVFVPGWTTHLELSWDDPPEAAFRERLASFSRLILFDKRGTGLSDRVPVDELPILEQRCSVFPKAGRSAPCSRRPIRSGPRRSSSTARSRAPARWN
jgi:pimeloyl-ACP methyl ester carboxylesterase